MSRNISGGTPVKSPRFRAFGDVKTHSFKAGDLLQLFTPKKQWRNRNGSQVETGDKIIGVKNIYHLQMGL